MHFSPTILSPGQVHSVVLHQGCSAQQLASARLDSFDSLWNSPRDFVEPVNYRRNGWSAVSTLIVPDGNGGQARFFLKRQENQKRYSWRYPTGVLTYQYEVDALLIARRRHWPCVGLAAYGFRESHGVYQGFVLTKAIEYPALSSYQNSEVDWRHAVPVLERIGASLYAMHSSRWQHGALFPGHLFVDLQSGACQLIDFERSRSRPSVALAAEADLSQLLRRSDWLPGVALNALLSSHMRHLPGVINHLRSEYPTRFNRRNDE